MYNKGVMDKCLRCGEVFRYVSACDVYNCGTVQCVECHASYHKKHDGTWTKGHSPNCGYSY